MGRRCSRVPARPLYGWIAVVATDREQIDLITQRSTWTLVGSGALALVLAAILGVFLSTTWSTGGSAPSASPPPSSGRTRCALLHTTQEALAEQRKAASEREVLLREIYHRVKNNLQIIQSLLRLGSRHLSHEQREPFESAIQRIGAMARVHTLLYRSADLASIDLKDYLDEVVKETADGFGGGRCGASAPTSMPRPCAFRSTPPCRSPSSPSKS
jgi:hypothetical protein